MIKKKDFDNATSWEKGYAVYMFGAVEEEPYVPIKYSPTSEEQVDYNQGQKDAIINTIDSGA